LTYDLGLSKACSIYRKSRIRVLLSSLDFMAPIAKRKWETNEGTSRMRFDVAPLFWTGKLASTYCHLPVCTLYLMGSEASWLSVSSQDNAYRRIAADGVINVGYAQ